jgi:hypothetical protein
VAQELVDRGEAERRQEALMLENRWNIERAASSRMLCPSSGKVWEAAESATVMREW